MKIKSVTPKTNHRGSWWLIRVDVPGHRAIATDDMFKASLAERARESNAEVRILTSSGWYYDDLSQIVLVESPVADRSR